MKNVAIITHSLDSGGAERIAGLLSKKLEKIYNVYIFVLHTDHIVYEYGGRLVDIGDEGIFYESSLKKNKEKYKIDVAISFLEMMNLANIRSRGNEKIIISERCAHSSIVPKAYADELIINRYYDQAEEIVACSFGTGWDLKNYYGVGTSVSEIYNFIDQELIREKSKENLPNEISSFLQKEHFLLNIGRLDVQKNQQEIISEYKKYLECGGMIKKLLILGSGPLFEEIEDFIESLHLKENVMVIPYCKNPFSFIKRATALIQASIYEGLPNVILEAMTLGCPVISSDCLSGPRELLNDELNYEETLGECKICKRGILVPLVKNSEIKEETKLSVAMRMIEDAALRKRISETSVEYMEQYSNELILKQWIEVIEKKEKNLCEMKEYDQNLLKAAKKIMIYGAGKYAGLCYERYAKEYKISGFVVGKRDNPNSMMNLPVVYIDDITDQKDEVAIILGVSYMYQNEVVGLLQEKGFNNIVFA